MLQLTEIILNWSTKNEKDKDIIYRKPVHSYYYQSPFQGKK